MQPLKNHQAPFLKPTPLLLLIIIGLLLSACKPQGSSASDGKLKVVATTSIVGDVVQNIGGDNIDLNVLIPPGTDEHGYQPTPQDIVKTSQANLVFMNGAGLEQFIDKLLQNAANNNQPGSKPKLISVSDGIDLVGGSALDGENPGGKDPHVWTDPNNVLVWVDNIEQALSTADPDHSADYTKNASRYRLQLQDLDGWIQQQVARVPETRRQLVTDHLIFTYFAMRYKFQQAGAVIPGYSSAASPSAQELAALENTIQKLDVPVVFVGNTVNPALSQRVSQDTHTRLVQILTGSLTGRNGPGSTYIDYMKYNVEHIIKALNE
jgi:manganese/iron transport system substrate-binding protein